MVFWPKHRPVYNDFCGDKICGDSSNINILLSILNVSDASPEEGWRWLRTSMEIQRRRMKYPQAIRLFSKERESVDFMCFVAEDLHLFLLRRIGLLKSLWYSRAQDLQTWRESSQSWQPGKGRWRRTVVENRIMLVVKELSEWMFVIKRIEFWKFPP